MGPIPSCACENRKSSPRPESTGISSRSTGPRVTASSPNHRPAGLNQRRADAARRVEHGRQAATHNSRPHRRVLKVEFLGNSPRQPSAAALRVHAEFTQKHELKRTARGAAPRQFALLIATDGMPESCNTVQPKFLRARQPGNQSECKTKAAPTNAWDAAFQLGIASLAQPDGRESR